MGWRARVGVVATDKRVLWDHFAGVRRRNRMRLEGGGRWRGAVAAGGVKVVGATMLGVA